MTKTLATRKAETLTNWQITDLINRVTAQEVQKYPKSHGLHGLFNGFKYSGSKGFDHSKLILLASEFTFTDNGEYCYFAHNQQVNGAYYIKVIRLSDLANDLITYCTGKEDAKNTIQRIKNNSQFNNPEAIKYSFYCGSGLVKLHLTNYNI